MDRCPIIVTNDSERGGDCDGSFTAYTYASFVIVELLMHIPTTHFVKDYAGFI